MCAVSMWFYKCFALLFIGGYSVISLSLTNPNGLIRSSDLFTSLGSFDQTNVTNHLKEIGALIPNIISFEQCYMNTVSTFISNINGLN